MQRWRDGKVETLLDEVAEEAAIAFSYNGVAHVVMLATPSDLEDLATGFTLSEAVVTRGEEIRSLEVVRADDSLEVRIGIASGRFSELLQRRRNLAARSGCGLCGAETVEQAIRQPLPVTSDIQISTAELHAALGELRGRQKLNARTGSVHAAAWARPGVGIQIVREDVGRHNALDKVIGALARARADFSSGYMIVTSRASYEMVQKSAIVGVPLLVAVSAPTALAVRLAEQSGLTLIGFARERQHVVYAHGRRLLA
ncbi:MAG TPA: formate dehydrogenase accessory sulfurtransferase FdhD [Steroidobacteraceae bacterium]|nr:formate dehydrogenase accessory sulfurtransferase FdhD [Steroidobacteraceae bacterium]